MELTRTRLLRGIVLACTTLGFAVASGSATAAPLKVTWMTGFAAPGTPAQYNKVGVIKIGPSSAKNVLVLEPGTSAGAAYFVPLAQWLVSKTHGWQVWSVERRENLFEDQSEMNLAKQGKASGKQLFDYYLGYLADPGIAHHIHPVPDSQVGFARGWGLNVAIEDLHRVIEAAKRRGGQVVLGGHSLGGSVVTAYATWDFHGQAGANDLAGLVYDDGASFGAPVSAADRHRGAAKASGHLSVAGVQRDPRTRPRPVCGDRLTRSVDRPQRRVGRLHVPAVAAVAQDTGAADEPRTVRFRHRSKDIEARLRRPGARRPARHERHPGGLGPCRRDHPASALGRDAGRSRAAERRWKRVVLPAAADRRHRRDRQRDQERRPGVSSTSIRPTAAPCRGRCGCTRSGPTAERRSSTRPRPWQRSPTSQRRNLTLVNRHSTYAHNDPAGAYPRNVFFDDLISFLAKISPHK